ncbi:MAG: hypothetical protein AAGK21_16970 [Bacteroidota bacterium]
MRESVHRAVHEMGTVSGAFASAPCAFRPLDASEADFLSPRQPSVGTGCWVLVTISGSSEADHQAHLRERSRTAAQRFLLTLACEGIQAEWVADPPDAAELRAGGIPMGREEAIGLIWCTEE